MTQRAVGKCGFFWMRDKELVGKASDPPGIQNFCVLLDPLNWTNDKELKNLCQVPRESLSFVFSVLQEHNNKWNNLCLSLAAPEMREVGWPWFCGHQNPAICARNAIFLSEIVEKKCVVVQLGIANPCLNVKVGLGNCIYYQNLV